MKNLGLNYFEITIVGRRKGHYNFISTKENCYLIPKLKRKQEIRTYLRMFEQEFNHLEKCLIRALTIYLHEI